MCVSSWIYLVLIDVGEQQNKHPLPTNETCLLLLHHHIQSKYMCIHMNCAIVIVLTHREVKPMHSVIHSISWCWKREHQNQNDIRHGADLKWQGVKWKHPFSRQWSCDCEPTTHVFILVCIYKLLHAVHNKNPMKVWSDIHYPKNTFTPSDL